MIIRPSVARTVGVSILVLAALCGAPTPVAAQYCGGGVTTDCINVTNPTDPSGITATFSTTSTGVSINILRSGSFDLSPTLSTDSTITIKANTAVGIVPRIVLSTGKIVENWTRQQIAGAATPETTDDQYTVTIKINPRAVSYTTGTCNPSSCDNQATNDFSAMAIMTVSSLEESGITATFRTAADKAYISTTGQYFSNPSSASVVDPNDPGKTLTALQFEVGSPHCKAGGAPESAEGCTTSAWNKTGGFKFRAPSALVALLNTTASELISNGAGVSVGGKAQPASIVSDGEGGVVVESSQVFGFSTPTVSVTASTTTPRGLTISPSVAVIPAGPTKVTIKGSDFLPGAGVRVRGNRALDVTVLNEQTIEAVLPPLPNGIADVVITNANGRSAVMTGAFTYPLSLTAISPSSGPMRGGVPVALTGAYFGGGETVRLGGAALANVVVDSGLSTLRGNTGARSAGTVDVVITTLSGQSVTLAGAFTYDASDLTITKSGTGSGSVASTPSGISCGADCTERYTSSGTVTLKATPDPDSNFLGWSGDPDCGDGVVTVDATKTCTATFVRLPGGAAVDLGTDGFADAFTYNVTTGAWSMETGSGQGAFTPRAGSWSPDWVVRAADFNVDRRADMFLYNLTTGAWFKATNDGQGGFTYFNSTWSAGWNTYIVDLDGDGPSDVFLYNPLTGVWFKCLTTAGGDFSYISGTWDAALQVYPVEWNGDGRADFLLYNGSNGAWSRATNDGGTGFTYATGTWAADWAVYPGDFSGDGRSEILVYNASTGAYFVYTSSGSTFTSVGGSWPKSLIVRVLDLDGDARADVFLYNDATGAWQEGFGDGAGGFSLSAGSWSPSWRLYATDFDGNRRADLLLYNSTTGTWFQAINQGVGVFQYGTGSWASGLAIVAAR